METTAEVRGRELHVLQKTMRETSERIQVLEASLDQQQQGSEFLYIIASLIISGRSEIHALKSMVNRLQQEIASSRPAAAVQPPNRSSNSTSIFLYPLLCLGGYLALRRGVSHGVAGSQDFRWFGPTLDAFILLALGVVMHALSPSFSPIPQIFFAAVFVYLTHHCRIIPWSQPFPSVFEFIRPFLMTIAILVGLYMFIFFLPFVLPSPSLSEVTCFIDHK